MDEADVCLLLIDAQNGMNAQDVALFSLATRKGKETAEVNTNWQDLAFQNAPISEYDLNISGGDAKTKFYVSGQYLDQTGILVRNASKRYSGRANLEHKVKDWLTAGINLAFARSLNGRVSNDNAFSTPLQIVHSGGSKQMGLNGEKYQYCP
jgi:hypothetical protein